MSAREEDLNNQSTESFEPIEDAHVTKRDGEVVTFDQSRIYIAIAKAFKADLGLSPDEELPEEATANAQRVTSEVVNDVIQKALNNFGIHQEEIQDVVEMQLMRFGHYTVAKKFIVYRQEQAKARKIRSEHSATTEQDDASQLLIKHEDGSLRPLEWVTLHERVERACEGLPQCSPEDISTEIARVLYSNMTQEELDKALIMAARTKIEQEPAYSYVTARLLLDTIYMQVLGFDQGHHSFESKYKKDFVDCLKHGIENEILDSQLLDFDLEKISAALKPERDRDFQYLGLQTIFDRYLLHVNKKRFETPQYFWMRVSMGLSVREENKEERAIEFYNTLSTFRFVSSTPTLFNSGTLHPQLSSCYLSTISDDLEHIFKVISDNAKLSKWAGGLGNDWTSVRSTGARIKGTNGESQGVIPFLKVANDTAVAVNQGGKRKGAVCAYLESWHLEIEEFLEMRKNTGDERRRTHDMNTANWIPDLFMKRVIEDKSWTLFSPNEAPDLHDLYGQAFEKRYEEYEELARQGKMHQHKVIPAGQLWRKMLSMVFETGHPWITFKDPSNIRSPQDHAGVVHSSNLCTEILLNTSETETAVCNLGSINLVKHIEDHELNEKLVEETITTAVRMLDNVIDINFYPTKEAHNSNLKHRPVGLGLMGFQDALYLQGLPYESEDAVVFADRSMELISYYAILASTKLAQERGTYESYKGSKWDRGLLPIDTIDLLEKERGGDFVQVDKSSLKDWGAVRERVKKHGMRNSNVMAIAPTATIANITGINQSIEPTYRNLYVKSNLSGEFTVINPYLVEDLKKLGLWDNEMVDDLKYFDGSLQEIDRIPENLKKLYATAFEIDQDYLIDCASRRQKWIDMGQSLNLYLGIPDGKRLSDMYMKAWKTGLKTTYYLRSLGATQIEKSSMDVNKRGIQPRWMKNKSASSEVGVEREPKVTVAGVSCDPNDTDCEACQ